MCGRYTLSKGEKIIEAVPNVTIREDLRKVMEMGRWNIAPSQDILVAVARLVEEDPAREPVPAAELMHWGLVPAWAKDSSLGNRMINARAETLREKPAFRKSLERRRCAIVADGFYEWRARPDGGGKTPMYITLRNGSAFAFAGLWDTWKDPQGQLLHSCTIITTPPNSLLETIHNRMPAILPPEAVRQWLDPRQQSAEEAARLLQPYPAEAMQATPVSRAVNSVQNEGADLVKPVSEAAETGDAPASRKRKRKQDDPAQGRLF